jgi:hypothetical protein
MPQIRLRPFMAPDNGHFRPVVKTAAGIALPKCNARRGNRAHGQIAIAGAAEIMKLNRGVGPGALTHVLNQVSTGAP